MWTTLVACATRRTGQPPPWQRIAIRAPAGAVTVSREMRAPPLVRTPRIRTSGNGLIICGRAGLRSVAPRTTSGTVGCGSATVWATGVDWTPLLAGGSAVPPLTIVVSGTGGAGDGDRAGLAVGLATANDRVAEGGSVLPAWSGARTKNVYAPSARLRYARGEVHAA